TVIGCPVKSNPILRYNGDRSRFCLFILTACSYSIFLPLTLYQKTSTADSGFNELNRAWFDRLGLGKVIEQSLREQPLIGTHVERCFVVGATQTKEEGAD